MSDDLLGDLYSYESLLSDDERKELAGIREFLQEEVRPRVNDSWESATFPMDLIPRFAEQRLVGRSYDLAGSPRASRLFTGFISLEASRVDPRWRPSSVSTTAWRWVRSWSSARRSSGSAGCRTCWRLRTVGCFALTEPHGGSDVALGLETTARQDGDAWVLDGAKRWIGNGTFADLVVVFARDVADDQVKTFVVEKGTPGFTATKMEGKYALRTVQNADLVFEGCRVPAENKLAGGNSFKDVNRVLKLTRGGVAWNAVGCQMGAFEAALAYAKERVQFGRPIAGFQLIQDLLARMAGNVTASLGMAVRVAQLQEEGVFRDDHAALAKSFVTSRGRETVAWARELFGGNGILLDRDVIRYFNDAEALYSYEGTREINNLIVGRALTGHSAFV
jgi:glutaryl-CoA dehydrogenase